MKNITLFLLLLGLALSFPAHAQLPSVLNESDYSTKSGTYTDPRDGKEYAYKKFKGWEWFMQNLNWDGYDGSDETTRGTVGVYSSEDPDGSKFGRYYHTDASKLSLCPPGWVMAKKANWIDLFAAVKEEYEAAGLEPKNANNWTIFKAGLYLRGGEAGADKLWTVGAVDPKAAQIQFNMLPSGGYNGTDYENPIGTTTYFLIGGNEKYYTATGTSGDNHHENMRHDNTSNRYGNVRCIRYDNFPDGEIKTKYPIEFEINQINSAEKERRRLAQSQKKFDQQPTGFYVEKGKKVVVKVDIISPAADGTSPAINIGTMGQKNNTRYEISLKSGVNTIEPSKHEGGLIYLKYVTEDDAEPQGKVKITFEESSEHVRAPKYVYGETTDEEFSVMLGKYRTEDVTFFSDTVLVVASRQDAIDYSMNEEKVRWMGLLHKTLELEDEISALTHDDPNPLHRRHKAGEVRHLLVGTSSVSSHASPAGYTAYNNGDVPRYLTYKSMWDEEKIWTVGHEVGHQHQQDAYKVNQATESTVNLYPYFIMKYMYREKGVAEYHRTPVNKWETMHNTYFGEPVENRIYDMDDQTLKAMCGNIDYNEVRFMPWELLFTIFGNDFYKTLHRIAREEQYLRAGSPKAVKEQKRRHYLIWKSSQITGYDLREYFNEWGIRVTDESYKKLMTQQFNEALNTEVIKPLPLSIENYTKLIPQNKPAWAPLEMRGIKSSAPDRQPEDRLASKDKYCDYSTSTGAFQDARDEKIYTYKKYGTLDWFTQNLDYADDRINEPVDNMTNNYPMSLNIPADPDGKVYGRLYLTYPKQEMAASWCPEGWRSSAQSDFSNLYSSIKSDYNISTDEELNSCLICGGERNLQSDGLWKKGLLNMEGTDAKRKEIGFNILPAGVYNYRDNLFDTGDEEGAKASFYELTSLWYHQVFSTGSTQISRPNRNGRHYGSIRCVRDAATMVDQAILFDQIPQKGLDSKDFDLGAIATSGLPVTYSSSNENVAVVVDGKVQIKGMGTTVISASQGGNSTYNPSLVLERELVVIETVKQNQTITFNEMPSKYEGDEDFDPEATASSGLPVTYTSSNEGVATIVGNKIHIVAAGTTVITASQAGDDEYKPAESVSKTLNVFEFGAVAIRGLQINGEEWNIETPYIVPADYRKDQIDVFVDTDEGVTVDRGNNFTVDVKTPSIQYIEFNVKKGENAEQKFILTVEKLFRFWDIVALKWNNTFIVNNNTSTNGGYNFTSYKWFKNGTEVSSRQYYQEKNDETATYSVELEAEGKGKLKTWTETVSLKNEALRIYPNPIKAGQTLYIDASLMPEEFLNNAELQVYSLSGTKTTSNVLLKSAVTSFDGLTSPGSYILKVKSGQIEQEFKIIVKP